jgi:hypothetical protein
LKRRHSLSGKLLGLFLLTALLLSLVIKVGFYIGFGNHWQEIIQPHITEYLNHLLTAIGNPPDIARTKAVTQRLPLDITIQGENINWSSSQTPLKSESLTFSTHTLTNGQEIQIAHPHGRFFIRANIGNAQITFQPRQSYSSTANWAAITKYPRKINLTKKV